MSCPTTNFKLTGYITIDKANSSDGQLQETRELYKNVAYPHDSRSSAIKNAFAVQSTMERNIVGIGTPGRIFTGSGDIPIGPDKEITFNNSALWKQDLDSLQLQTGLTVTLCACHTGASDSGADLLFEMAKKIQGTVLAPTGFVYIHRGCKSLDLQDGTFFQKATKNVRPEPVKPQKPYESNFDKDNLGLMYPEGLVWVSVKNVSLIQLLSADGMTIVGQWSASNIMTALGPIAVEFPHQYDGSPLASVTGHIAIRYRRQAVEEERVFRTYNDLLMQDITFRSTYCHANIDELRAAL